MVAMGKYGFLFGAGAEIAYNLPSGGQFALDIFRQSSDGPKRIFKKMRDEVDSTTPYANDWLPDDYSERNLGVFGKTVFESIISSTIEHNREYIIEKINDLDLIAFSIIKKMNDRSVDEAFIKILKREVKKIQLAQDVAYNANFEKGNKLFKSNYFSAMLLVYKKMDINKKKTMLGNILFSIMQLQLGALSEEFSKSINSNIFSKKDDGIDLFDDFGEMIRINYNAAGVTGLELLSDKNEFDINDEYDVILKFAKEIIENVYASVLDYKILIDSNWANLYYPKADWAKFCKISIFLITVREYIVSLGDKADKTNPNGHYHILKKAIDSGKIEISKIATTNYNDLIEVILEKEVTYLNGSTSTWYDPYLNKIGPQEDLENEEHHIVVPLIFTQSGTKPMTAISMSEQYVELYHAWKKSDAVVIVGFGFGPDDEHINGILRTLVDVDGKTLIIVTKGKPDEENAIIKQKVSALKISDSNKVRVIAVDDEGKNNGQLWVDKL